MTLIIHIIIALLSIGLATWTFLRPSSTGLRVAYSSVALTFISGFYLVWISPAHMLQACMSGLVYLAVVVIALLATHYRLTRTEQSSHADN